MVSWVGKVPSYTSCAAVSSAGRPWSQKRVHHVRKLIGPYVADKRAVQARETRPVDRRARLAFVFMAANECQGVAAARIGERHACIRRARQARRHAGDNLEVHALLVQEQRLGTAVVEHERVAPLQTRDDLALPRLFGEQVTDGFLLVRLRRSAADVNCLARPGPAWRSRRLCTRWSARTTSAAARHSSPRTVISPGSPGPRNRSGQYTMLRVDDGCTRAV